MILLKYNDVIKKATLPWLLFWCFLKDPTYYHIHARFHSQGSTVSAFMTGEGGGRVGGGEES